jgi:hypothetical protein
MHCGLMTNEVMFEAIPWLVWSLGFSIVYVMASLADDAKLDIEEENEDA